MTHLNRIKLAYALAALALRDRQPADTRPILTDEQADAALKEGIGEHEFRRASEPKP